MSIHLTVPNPMPDGAAPYNADLRITLQRKTFAEPWWQESPAGQWLEETGDRALGTLDGWMDRSTPLHKRSCPAAYQFPLGPKGLGLIAEGKLLRWIDERQKDDVLYAQLGIVRSDTGELVVMYSPRAEVNARGDATSSGLLDVDRLVFGIDLNAGTPSYTQAPLIMAYSLASYVGDDGWDLFVQWRALRTGGKSTALTFTPCLFDQVLDTARWPRLSRGLPGTIH